MTCNHLWIYQSEPEPHDICPICKETRELKDDITEEEWHAARVLQEDETRRVG